MNKTKIIKLVIIIVFAILNNIIYFTSHFTNMDISNKENKKNIPDVEFPSKNIKDENGKNLNIMALTAPFRGDEHKRLFNEYTQKYNIPFIGISSYLNFPGKITHPFDDPYYKKHFNSHDYINSCIGWCNCLRNQESLYGNKPRIELSESDLVIHNFEPSKEKVYDFIYICLKDNDKCTHGWQSENRNWELAKKCLPIMCKEFNLKGLLVGRKNCDMDESCNNLLTIEGDDNNEGKIEYNEIQKKLAQSRFLFLPNIRDASPRILAEALVVDVPVLVNRKIYGGWKYVNEHTGEFFDDENNFREMLQKLLHKIREKKYSPKNWFRTRYSPEISGKKLRDFIKSIYPQLWDCKYCTFTR